MKKRLLNYLLCSLMLFSPLLSGQGFDVAEAFKIGGSAIVTGLEPAENGLRDTYGSSFAFDLEMRSGKRIGWLLSFPLEVITSHKRPETTEDVPEPSNMVHPYRSSLFAFYLMPGAQYNFTIGQGDLSLGILVGPGIARYSRTWDVLSVDIEDGIIVGAAPYISEFTDGSNTTWRLNTIARVEYTYWFSKRMALSLGAEYRQSNYLSGGVDVNEQLRYELGTREFIPTGILNDRSPLIFNVNYDRSTLVPDPGNIIRQLHFTIGFINRFKISWFR